MEWNLAMTGGTCLGLVAQTVQNDIMPLAMPLIEGNITKPDWRQRKQLHMQLVQIWRDCRVRS
ncbi:Importin subunit beta-1 [Ranunculus cassubicifolius]